MPVVFPSSRKAAVLRRRRTTVRRTEQNQPLDEEIGKTTEQLRSSSCKALLASLDI
jgi:hypothetical protein